MNAEPWLWPQDDTPVEPTEHIVFFINGEFVTELTMLKDTAGSFIQLRPFTLPAGEYTFEFASLTHEQFHAEFETGGG